MIEPEYFDATENFAIVHRRNPEQVIYEGATRHAAWREFYRDTNVTADNQKEFQAQMNRRGYSCVKLIDA